MMKKVLVLVLTGVLLHAACKKKEKNAEPEPAPVAANVISAKVDDVEKSCNSACFSSSASGGLRGIYFYIAGPSEYIYFSCSALPTPGTYTLVKYGKPYLMYGKDNVYRPASAGTINISEIDTSSKGVITKLIATFSFKTDTSSSGTSYNITNGVFNLKN